MILQHLADGILTGAIVSLGAIGLSLTMRILKFANFSHAELLTFGAYAAMVFLAFTKAMDGVLGGSLGPFSFGLSLVVATVLAGGLTALAALAIDRLVFARLRHRAGHMTLVFASFGVALLLRNLILIGFGPDPYYYSRELQMAIRLPFDVLVLPDQIFVLALTIVLVIALHLFLTRTRAGIAMRGVAESPSLASACGIDVDAVIRWTWILGGVGAAVAGVLYGLTVQLRPELGFSLLLPLFAAVILGGTGSMYGAVIGGLIVGLAENLSVMVIPASYKPAIPFLLILLILYIKPQGLFGEAK
ncbi:MAG: branched-chain amino acid ABC transporter permease [Alphaproteobacteria bacterium]|nr:branched-chain amino acid ABC transporter permease [Alphaproteobacteria bacterium]